jgi:hypothetical protein
MKVFYNRYIVEVTEGSIYVAVPEGLVVRAVFCNIFTLPFVAPGVADAATVTVKALSLVEDGSSDASIWLAGMENVTAWQPLRWDGELHLERAAKAWLTFENATVGNQLELAVVTD